MGTDCNNSYCKACGNTFDRIVAWTLVWSNAVKQTLKTTSSLLRLQIKHVIRHMLLGSVQVKVYFGKQQKYKKIVQPLVFVKQNELYFASIYKCG